jgi:small subunit ribosomal protein S18
MTYFKNINLYKKFITNRGKILSRNTTQLTSKKQNKLKKAIKYARILNLLPFVKYKNLSLNL